MPSKPGRPPNVTTRHGRGIGWGGPARGAGNGNPSIQDDPAAADRGRAVAHNPDVRAAVAHREAQRLAEYEQVLDEMFRIATKGAREADRVTAGVAFGNRVMGMPAQRNYNTTNDITGMTREQIEAEIARIERLTGRSAAPRSLAAGASPGVPGEPADVVPDRS